MSKRLYQVDVEVHFEPTTARVLVWANDEDEAEQLASEDDECPDPNGVDRVDVESVEEVDEQEVRRLKEQNDKGWTQRVLGLGGDFTWEAALLASQEEQQAATAWAAQGTLPGMKAPPLPQRCESCGGRPPLTPHAEDCEEKP